MKKLIVCMDTRGGMAFHSRRVSRDREVYSRILKLCEGSLWLAPYSRSLFPAGAELHVAENFLELAGESDWCFVETEDPGMWLNKAEQVMLFGWNRAYPSDLKFPISRLEYGWELVSTEDFSGNSHERITMEVYRRCEKNG